jgi:L-alanine-DL-glutamate epimerase-like enolase superfamily enzyme
MKIIGIEITPITLEWKKVEIDSYGPVGQREDDVIIQIFTDEGISGLGEAMALGPFYSKESQGTIMALLNEQIGPSVLIGEDPFNIDLIHHSMNKMVSENYIMKSAVDIALHDVVAKALNIPVYKLIGGAYTEKIPCHWAVGIGKVEEMVADALQGIKAGYGALKLKAGIDPKQDVENIGGVREAVGPNIPITVDFNQGYDVKRAIQVIRRMERYNIQRVEQPVHYKDLEGMATVKRSVEVPIGACESAMTMQDVVQIIKKEAADFINFKLMRSGGFYLCKSIVQMATASGMFVAGSPMLGTGIEIAADVHFAVSTIELGAPPYNFQGIVSGILKLFNTVDSKGITKDIVDGTPTIADGFVYVPEGPGLGVELNKENLNFYLTKGKKPILIGKKS